MVGDGILELFSNPELHALPVSGAVSGKVP